MKRLYIYGILIMALLALGACHRADPEKDLQQGDLIRINAVGSELQTKALLNGVDVQKAGTEVKIYDWLTGFTGKIGDTQYNNGNVMYIDDAVTCTADGNGTLVNDGTWAWNTAPWRWTRTGVHHFYGWLLKDKDEMTSNGSGTVPTFDASTKTLNVPTITFTKETPQFDFSYSDIVTKSVPEDVELPLKHLFSALAVTIQNNGDSDATIVSVSMENLKNTKRATIDYSGTSAALTMTAAPDAQQTEFLAENFTNKDFDHGGTKYDLVTGQQIASSAKGSYYMMWPQTAAEVGVKDGEGAIKFVVTYTYDGIYDEPVGDNPAQLHEYTATCYLAEAVTALEAGHKYAINLQFKGKSLEISVIVMPWQAKYYDLDYSTSSIQANSAASAGNEGVLWLYTWEYDEDNAAWRWFPGPRDRKITMDSGKDIKGDFTILSPRSGQWQITTYPAEATQYFTISPSSGSIDDLVDPQGNFTGYVDFIISPNGNVPSIQKLYFNVDIEINGVWRNANSEFNRKNWELTRLP